MKQQRQSVILAGLLALAFGLSACSSTRGGSDSETSGSGDMSNTGSGTGATGSAGTLNGGSAALDGAGTAGAASGASTQNWSPNATVVAIEVVPRSAGATGETSAGASAMGSSGAAGSTGSSGGTERIYRVTLRLDDGSTAVVTQETTPMFRSGDRVALAGGMIQH